MTPDRIATMERVREALNKAKSQHAPLFISLTKNGSNRPFDCKPPARVPFGPEQNDFPSLGKKQSPFASNALPSLRNLQQLLVADLRASRQTLIDETNDAGAMQLETNESQTDEDKLKQIDSLTNGNVNAISVVLSFPSSSLDDMCGDRRSPMTTLCANP